MSDIRVPGKVRGVCRDPMDDHVLECALIAKARVLVSGDKDLLVLVNYENTRILTPRQYLNEQVPVNLRML